MIRNKPAYTAEFVETRKKEFAEFKAQFLAHAAAKKKPEVRNEKRETLIALISKHNANVTHMAKETGISRRKMYRELGAQDLMPTLQNSRRNYEQLYKAMRVAASSKQLNEDAYKALLGLEAVEL